MSAGSPNLNLLLCMVPLTETKFWVHTIRSVFCFSYCARLGIIFWDTFTKNIPQEVIPQWSPNWSKMCPEKWPKKVTRKVIQKMITKWLCCDTLCDVLTTLCGKKTSTFTEHRRNLQVGVRQKIASWKSSCHPQISYFVTNCAAFVNFGGPISCQIWTYFATKPPWIG